MRGCCIGRGDCGARGCIGLGCCWKGNRGGPIGENGGRGCMGAVAGGAAGEDCDGFFLSITNPNPINAARIINPKRIITT